MIEEEFREYTEGILRQINQLLTVSTQAKRQKKDPSDKVEVAFCYSLDKKIELITGLPGLNDFLKKIRKDVKDDFSVALKVTEQILDKNFTGLSEYETERLFLIAIRTALVILSKGSVTVPEESIPKVEINRTTKHLTIFFSTSIKYASGRDIGLIILIADYLRHRQYLKPFNVKEEVIGRYHEELEYFLENNDSPLRLSYDLIKRTLGNIKVELSGEPIATQEVKKYRNLPNVTNRLRPGMCVAIQRFLERIPEIRTVRNASGILEWEWLNEIATHEILKQKSVFKITDFNFNRPIISDTTHNSGFRLRYGRSRNVGLGTVGIHPAVMFLLELISPGTQVMLDIADRPFTVTPVTTIDGPFIETENGDVIRVQQISKINELVSITKKIIDLGDVLIAPEDFPFADSLEPSSWTEELWSKLVKKELGKKYPSRDVFVQKSEITTEDLSKMLFHPLIYKPSFEQAYSISGLLDIPLHPKYSFCWSNLSFEEFTKLIKYYLDDVKDKVDFNEISSLLKKLGVSHKLKGSTIKCSKDFSHVIKIIKKKKTEIDKFLVNLRDKSPIDIISKILEVPVINYTNKRFGVKILRTEVSTIRRTSPSSHILFPIGNTGGIQRNLLVAKDNENLSVQLAERYCPHCNIRLFLAYCPKCKKETIQRYRCKEGHLSDSNEGCSICGTFNNIPFGYHQIDLKRMIQGRLKKLGIKNLEKLKGVRYLRSYNKIPEDITKGILRAKNNLYVFKDGTVRFDHTNAFITHFRIDEINTSVGKLKELGYNHDVAGNPLMSADQLIELNPYDIIINEKCKDFLIRVSNFVDEELTRFYNLEPVYSIKDGNDLIGRLVVGISPSSRVGIVGRIIGVTNSNLCYSHPSWHVLKGRNCNGDIDSLTLLVDLFLNYSPSFLPTVRGGQMDIAAIIYFPTQLRQLDDQTTTEYLPISLDFYNRLKDQLRKEELLRFIVPYSSVPLLNDHSTGEVFIKVKNRLKTLTTDEKISFELKISEKLVALDPKTLFNVILENNFLKLTTKSIKRFFKQPFRCKKCYTTFRRIPLSRTCPICGELDSFEHTQQIMWLLKQTERINNYMEKYQSIIYDKNVLWIQELNSNIKSLIERK